MSRKFLVTGGTGFLGSALVIGLLQNGHTVRILDNNWRGSAERLDAYIDHVELLEGDIRDPGTVRDAVRGMDAVCHLAYINGTRYFYEKPALVLDVGVKGMINVVDGCIQTGVLELILVSSSEVYQTPPIVPTPEDVPLTVPDPLNPRYSYAGGKIISELMAFNYGREYFERVVVVRPHNVYGPNMGWEHVIPEFALRMRRLVQAQASGIIAFPVQGTGEETRSFIYIDDFIHGMLRVIDYGEHLNIYHIGTMEELSIATVAQEVGRYFEREIKVVPGKLQPGSTLRRCPDISKVTALGYVPNYKFTDGLPLTVEWYDKNAHKQPLEERMS